MISIDHIEVKEAGRIYGAMTEKVAFNINVDPTSVLSALAGGYVANRVQSNITAGQQQKAFDAVQQKERIENDYYSQVSSVLNHLKIVFTPINVIFSVNGQVFEIIGVAEMTPPMKAAFLQKDGPYFRDILLKKMNTQIQLAQQSFAMQLLEQHGVKTANFLEQQEVLLKTAAEDFETMVSALEKTAAEMEPITIAVNLDSLRPFSNSALFFESKLFSKVAGLFDYFSHSNQESLSIDDLKNQVHVGFMPDRVLFLHRGQLFEQVPLLGMNPEGYEAFRRKDKAFFMNFFNHKTVEIASQVAADVAKDELDQTVEQLGSEVEDEEWDDAPTDVAVTPEDTTPLIHPSVTEREKIDFFRDPDIHPVLYAKILADRYGEHWEDLELASIFKQLELDFDLTHGIGDMPWNKIGMLYALMGDNSSIFSTTLTFEKFVRAMNDKDVDFSWFQADLDFEEIVFALDVAKAFRGPDVFALFHSTIAQYVAEELFRQGVRYICTPLYDTTNPFEQIFYSSINGYLVRKWKDKDAHGMLDEEEYTDADRTTEAINQIAETILTRHADEFNMPHQYAAIHRIILKERFLVHIPEEKQLFVLNAVIREVTHNTFVALYLEYKRQELEVLTERWKEEEIPHVEHG